MQRKLERHGRVYIFAGEQFYRTYTLCAHTLQCIICLYYYILNGVIVC